MPNKLNLKTKNVLAAVKRNKGNASAAAKELDCCYATVKYHQKKDAEAKAAAKAAR